MFPTYHLHIFQVVVEFCHLWDVARRATWAVLPATCLLLHWLLLLPQVNKKFSSTSFFFSGCLKSPKCQLEHSLSAHEVKNNVELESMERRGQEAKMEDEEGVLTKLHNIR